MNTMHQRILTVLRDKGSTTPKDWVPTLQGGVIDGGDECTRLAARIHELREMGFDIVGSTETSASGKRYSRYRLAAAGSDGEAGRDSSSVAVSSVTGDALASPSEPAAPAVLALFEPPPAPPRCAVDDTSEAA